MNLLLKIEETCNTLNNMVITFVVQNYIVFMILILVGTIMYIIIFEFVNIITSIQNDFIMLYVKRKFDICN